MPRYEVAVYLPRTTKAEARKGDCSSFEEARDWLEKRLRENPNRIGHFFGGTAQLTDDQKEWLQRYRIERH